MLGIRLVSEIGCSKIADPWICILLPHPTNNQHDNRGLFSTATENVLFMENILIRGSANADGEGAPVEGAEAVPETAAAAENAAKPKSFGFRGKRKKSQYGSKSQKQSRTYQQFTAASANNPVVADGTQVEDPAPEPIAIPDPTSKPKKKRADDNWRTNRAVASLERKLCAGKRKRVEDNNVASQRLDKEKHNRAQAEYRLSNERKKTAKAKKALKEEQKLRVTAEKKVSILFEL